MAYIILDRDGVINHDSESYIKSPDEWHPIDGSLAAIAKLNQHGFKVLVATNQSGIARGLYSHATLAQIHDKFVQTLADHGGNVEEIFFCPHHPDEGCACRKPKPGLLHQIADKYALNFDHTYFIGDSIVDMQAAAEAGCRPLLVLTGKGARMKQQYEELNSIPSFPDLARAVDYVLFEHYKNEN